jgi:hypothetical protein
MTRIGLLLASLALVSSTASASRHTLHHRLGTSSEWSPRGTITIDEAGASPAYEDLTGKTRPWDALPNYEEGSLYQLALTTEGASSVDIDSPMTFARAVSVYCRRIVTFKC